MANGEADIGDAGGQGGVAAAQLGQVVGHVVIVPRVAVPGESAFRLRLRA